MREVPASLSWVAFFVLKRLRLLESFESGNDSIIDAALTPSVSTFLAVFVDFCFTFLLYALMFQNVYQLTYLLPLVVVISKVSSDAISIA